MTHVDSIGAEAVEPGALVTGLGAEAVGDLADAPAARERRGHLFGEEVQPRRARRGGPSLGQDGPRDGRPHVPVHGAGEREVARAEGLFGVLAELLGTSPSGVCRHGEEYYHEQALRVWMRETRELEERQRP